jgi:phosphate-selective porin
MHTVDVLPQQPRPVFHPDIVQDLWQTIQTSLADVSLELLDITPSSQGVIFRAVYSGSHGENSQLHIGGTMLFILDKTENGINLRQLYMYSKR